METHPAGMDFFEGFALLAGALWIVGALLVGGLVIMGNSREGTVMPASNQTPIANSSETQ